MRILILAPIYPPQTGGTAVYFSLLTKELIKLSKIKRLFILTNFTKRAPIIESKRKLIVFRILPWGLFYGSRLDKVGVALNYLLLVPILLFAQFFIDLIHYNKQAFHKTIELLVPFIKVPLIFGKHDKDKLPKPKAYDKLIYIAKNILPQLQKAKIPSEKICYIPPLFAPPPKKGPENIQQVKTEFGIIKEYFLFLGDIKAEKGVYELVNGFLASKMREKFLLILAGNDRSKGYFSRFTKDKENIKYIGPVSHEKAISLLQGCQALVLPSKSEGLPRTCLEAISLGKKCVFPSGIPELEKAYPQFALKEISKEEIADILEKIAEIPFQIKYDFASHQPSKVAKQIYNLYLEVLKEKNES